MTTQYLRKVNLIVSQGGQGIDLSQMHIQFHVFAPDADAPPTAYIRVWNLSRDTANRVQNEFDHVSLQAGYVEPGIIFDGTVVQVKKGAQSAINRYVDIMASDLDEFYNFTMVSRTLAAGSTPRDRLDAVVAAGKSSGATLGSVPDNLGSGGTLPRGKVLFGMAREQMNSISRTAGASWFVQNGKINLVRDTGYLPDDIVVLNSETGMIGIPEATNAGIEITCLLNPRLRTGCRVQVDNASITTTNVKQQGAFPTYGAINLQASLSADGVYRVLVAEHAGDNRGPQFETKLTCLSTDSSASANRSVRAAG